MSKFWLLNSMNIKMGTNIRRLWRRGVKTDKMDIVI